LHHPFDTVMTVHGGPPTENPFRLANISHEKVLIALAPGEFMIGEFRKTGCDG
jgi:hypothetical protein